MQPFTVSQIFTGITGAAGVPLNAGGIAGASLQGYLMSLVASSEDGGGAFPFRMDVALGTGAGITRQIASMFCQTNGGAQGFSYAGGADRGGLLLGTTESNLWVTAIGVVNMEFAVTITVWPR